MGSREGDHHGSADRDADRDTSIDLTTREFVGSSLASTAAIGLAASTSGCVSGGGDGDADGGGAPGEDGESVTPTATVDRTVEVGANETLNEALAGEDGAVAVRLPEGVTEYDEPVTRSATTVVRGVGEEESVLRPSADVKLVQQAETIHPDLFGTATPRVRPLDVEQPGEYDGDLIFADLTIDRDNRPAPRTELGPDDEAADELGPNFLITTAGGQLGFYNVTMHRFNFADQEGVMMHATNRVDEIAFRNVTLDFQAGGGITNRPRARSRSKVFDGDADRLVIDEDCLFLGNTIARPPRVEPGNYGHITGLSANIYDHALVDGEWREWDYGLWIAGGPATPDATVEIRCDVPDAGFGDMFWVRGSVPDDVGGHVVYEDVTLTSASSNKYHDRGFKTVVKDWLPGEGFESVTIRDCDIVGRGAPIHIEGGGVEQLDISNVRIDSRGDGVIVESTEYPIGRVDISDVRVRPHESRAYYWQAIKLREEEPWGPEHAITDLEATGYLRETPIDDSTAEDTTVTTSNVRGEPATVTLDEGMGLGITPLSLGEDEIDGSRHGGLYGLPWGRMPGTLTVGDDFSVADGDPQVSESNLVGLTWYRDWLYCYVRDYGDHVPSNSAELDTGDVLRLGVAPDEAAPDEWIELDVGAIDGEGSAYVRTYPGDEGRPADVPVGVRVLPDRLVEMEVLIPWELAGVDPSERAIRLDLGFRDAAEDGSPRGTVQLGSSNGIWSSHDPADYKRTQLLGAAYSRVVSEDELP